MVKKNEYKGDVYKMLISQFINIIIVSIGLVIIFKIEKSLFKRTYYTVSQLLFDSVTVKQILTRIIIIMTYAFISHLIFNDSKTVLFGIFLGSFLIIWPVILNPHQLNLSEFVFDKEENTYTLDKKDYIVLLLLYAIFIASSVGAAHIAINVISLNDVKNELSSLIKNFVFVVIGMNISGWGEKFSSKKVVLKNRKVQEFYSEE